MSARTQLPDKLFFKIGDVADLVGVKPHVLRYWESEFPSLRPMKTRGAHRVYKRRDVELAMLIRRLLHDEGFTIPGAKKRIRELGSERPETEEGKSATREVFLRAELLGVREELSGLLSRLPAASPVKEAEPTREVIGAPRTVSATVSAQLSAPKPLSGPKSPSPSPYRRY
ncbi:MAG: MerR family transcriptional regulator [Sandaracinaceae bacterium]|nr:MerR family transcriptional regulator [Sandaracinaceae bacterium]